MTLADRDEELRELAEAEIRKNQGSVEADPYRLTYHHMPPTGLMNDPNGWIQWNGTYHLFYQWLPFHTGHGAKFWGHRTSEDLIHWTEQTPALTPSEWFDKDGAFSGSAVVADDQLHLFYTGNLDGDTGPEEEYQCAAVSVDGINFTKKGVVIERPEGYTSHFRDPKVWHHEGNWYMIVGAQTVDKQGQVLLYQSQDLENWEFIGPAAGSFRGPLKAFGYMWECPDLFPLNGRDVLIVSPQGLEPDGMDYANTYQSGFFTGTLDYDTGSFDHGAFRELDRGFEFYAPQTMEDEQGRRLLIGWMGVPDQEEEAHPTTANHWIHALTLPRELTWKDGRLMQSPAEELQAMRGPVLLHSSITIENDQKAVRGVEGRSIELNLEFEKLGDQFALEFYQYASLSYRKGVLTLSRPRLDEHSKTEFRRVRLEQPLNSLRIFADTSSLEIFVNGGEEVFTSRIFPQPEEEHILFTSLGESTFSIEKWNLSGWTLEQG